MEAINEELTAYLESWGAQRVGYADLALAQAEIEQYYGDAWQDYPYAVSVAIGFPRAVVNEVINGPSMTYVRYYEALNTNLDRISLLGALWLEERGYKAYPVPASQMMGETHLMSIFSHRLAARLAGLGWVGKCCSIITPERGGRQRFCTILTDAPLNCGSPLEERCGSCTLCTDICPVQAVKGVNWQPGQPLEERLDAPKCNEFLSGIRKTYGKSVCGRCLAVCPHGKQPPGKGRS